MGVFKLAHKMLNVTKENCKLNGEKIPKPPALSQEGLKKIQMIDNKLNSSHLSLVFSCADVIELWHTLTGFYEETIELSHQQL